MRTTRTRVINVLVVVGVVLLGIGLAYADASSGVVLDATTGTALMK
jgi:hypothetical protein